jgi:hypothetical protein
MPWCASLFTHSDSRMTAVVHQPYYELSLVLTVWCGFTVMSRAEQSSGTEWKVRTQGPAHESNQQLHRTDRY